MDYYKTYKTSSKTAIDRIKELESESARIAGDTGIMGFHINALQKEIDELKITLLDARNCIKAMEENEETEKSELEQKVDALSECLEDYIDEYLKQKKRVSELETVVCDLMIYGGNK